MPHFHLPVQSGSDAVLARMRRDYGVAAYLERFDRLAAARPGIAITTDFIVGLPGRDRRGLRGLAGAPRARPLRAELQLPLQPAPAHRRGAADGLGAGLGGGAARRSRSSGSSGSRRRSAGSRPRRLAAQLGRTVEVLVEGPSDEPGEVRGRTPENRVVHLARGRRGRAGGRASCAARITRAGQSSLSARLLAGS